jgi:5'(3')-deoxyribonucleotidase
MRIILDQDEVLCHWTKRILQYWNEDHLDRPPMTMADIHNWDHRTNMGPDSELGLRAYMRFPYFYFDLEAIDGAVEGVKQLLEQGHEIRIASSVPRSATMAYVGKVEWLRRHMPFFDISHFYACSHKEELEGDLLFDDGLHNLIPWEKRGRTAVAMARPWNKDWKGTRVESWPEFVKLVGELEPQDWIRKSWT